MSFKNKMIDKIIEGDNIELIKNIPSNSINCVITSPPYYQQRDYGMGIETEKTIDEYLEKLMIIFNECVRVLRNDGNIIYNLGDKYINKSLTLVPFRFAIKVLDKYPNLKIVNNITWVKTNPTPRQFKRRLISATEPFFHFVKTNDYYYDRDTFLADKNNTKRQKINISPKKGKKYLEQIKVSKLSDVEKTNATKTVHQLIQEIKDGKITDFRMKIRGIHSLAYGGYEGGRKLDMKKKGFTVIRMFNEKMKRDIITCSKETIPFSKHPAIFPKKLIIELIQLLTKEGDIVLDPYMGSGTTAIACKELKRHFVGFEINPDYCNFALKRLGNSQ
ncbi:MAG: DNA-methyltransferase [Candidatus Hodarchaeales archaeon]|jgi:site-specific DNA-methyltransferase (adenine-specific)